MTRRSLRNRRARFPETYTAPARSAPAGQVLPPGYRMVEVTPALQAAMRASLVEAARQALVAEYVRRLFVVTYCGRPVFAEVEQPETLGRVREFMRAALATRLEGHDPEHDPEASDFALVVREIPAHVEGDKVYPAE